MGRENSDVRKKGSRLSAFALFSAVLGVAGSARAAVIADWTFENSPPTNSGPIYADAGADAGIAAASGSHAGASTYSSPAGNGSAHSYASTNWAVGDYYQFTATAANFSDIQFVFDQTSSNTGPGQFQLEYSTGAGFTNFGSPYTVLANASPNPPWNATNGSTIYTTTDNLSSIAALSTAATATFRLVDTSTTSANGGTVGSSGTDRVDNVIIETVPSLAVLSLSVSTGVLNDNLLNGAPASDFTGTATVSNTGPAAGNYAASNADNFLSLTGATIGSVMANSSGTFGYGLATIPTANGVYGGTFTVTPSGTSNDTPLVAPINFYVGNPTADNSNSATTFGPYTYIAHSVSGGSLAGLSSTVSGVSGSGGAGALGSEAIIQYGSNNSGGTETIGEDWRTRTTAELAAGIVASDVIKLTGTVDDVFVLQVSYDPTITNAALALGQSIGGNWYTAASENYSGTPDDVGAAPWSSEYQTLGEYGYDPSADVAWAVIDHSGTFAVLVVPEPASISILAIGAVGLLRRRRLRR